MTKTIIKKKTIEYGTIELSYCRRDDGYIGIISFANEDQLKAFAIFLYQMVSFNAANVEVK
jgi:hypothetical protein